MKKGECVRNKEAVLRLAECLRKYGNYLGKQSTKTAENHKKLF